MRDFEMKQCLRSIKDFDCPLQSIENGLIENGTLVVWQIKNIFWARLIDGQIVSTEEIDPRGWLEFRAFNASEEIHAKRIGERFVGRHAIDLEGEGDDYVDSFARFWGERVESKDGFVRLLDRSRKLSTEIPIEDGAKFYGLMTRNYVGSDPRTGLSGYVDYRFVSIKPMQGGETDG